MRWTVATVIWAVVESQACPAQPRLLAFGHAALRRAHFLMGEPRDERDSKRPGQARPVVRKRIANYVATDLLEEQDVRVPLTDRLGESDAGRVAALHVPAGDDELGDHVVPVSPIQPSAHL